LTNSENYKLTKEERLSSEKKIGTLFKDGRAISYGCIRIIYLLLDEVNIQRLEVMFSVSKRNFKNATDRNLIKRRMREAYRIHKPDIQKNILIALLYTDKEIGSFKKIEQNLLLALKKLEKVV
jgi:ribonuclease P protein component